MSYQSTRLAALPAALLLSFASKGFAADAAQQLPEITISGAAEIPYVETGAPAAGKTAIPLIETPMSIQVVPREVLDDQQVISLKQAVQNVSGVIQPDYDFYDFMQIRGFKNGYAANYRNSLQLEAVTGHEIAFLDRIEVVKGPASMLYGRIEPGGLVNMVTRQPQAEPAYSLQVQAGSFDLLRGVADATGKLDQDGKGMYQVIGVHRQSGSFMDHVERRNTNGAGFLTLKPSDRLTINLGLEAHDVRFVDTEDNGIPIIGTRAARVPRHTFLGDPVGDMPNRTRRTLAAFDWTYAFSDQWKLTQRFHWDKRNEQQLTLWSNGFDGVSILDRGLWFVQPERETLAANMDLTGDFHLGGMRHRVLLGVDRMHATSKWHGFSDVTPLVPSIDIYNPTYGIDFAALKALPENFFHTAEHSWAGIYAQDQISLTSYLDVLIGGRYDWAKSGAATAGSLDAAKAALVLEEDKAFTPRVGLLYKLTPSASLYASYAESFGINNGRSASGTAFDPERGKQWELGLKTSLFGGRLNASSSLYRLEKSNVLTPDISTPDPNDQIAIGLVRNQGLEIDVSGQMTSHISLIAAYALSDAKIARDESGNQGNRMPNVPRHGGSLWVKYDTVPGGARGWQFGLGGQFRSQRQGDNENSWQLPGYGRLDGMIGYRLPVGGQLLTMQLNVENLLDRTYIDRSGFSSAKYGAPRNFVGSLKLDF